MGEKERNKEGAELEGMARGFRPGMLRRKDECVMGRSVASLPAKNLRLEEQWWGVESPHTGHTENC